MKKRVKRLELHTETLRSLDRGLIRVAAGEDDTVAPIFTCTIKRPGESKKNCKSAALVCLEGD